MAATSRADSRDAELERLRDELKKTQLRLEEVTNYYRGEIEAVRRRSEDELLQVQADEAARRRRAEDQANQLSTELKTARSEVEKSQRRYQELLNRIESIEAESRADVEAERDRYQDSASAAWQTAEQEVERLNVELAEVQRMLDQERAERQRVEQAQEEREASYERRDQQRQKLIARLKRALQASESRREALEQEGGAPQPAPSDPATAQASATSETVPKRADHGEVEVNPAAGWGGFQFGDGDDVAEEFMLIDADRSLSKGTTSASTETSEDQAAPQTSSDARGGSSGTTDDEAERLIMGVAVDQKVAQRQAADSGAADTAKTDGSGSASRPKSHRPPMPEAEPPWWRRGPTLIAGALLLAAVASGGVLWLI